MSCVERLMPTRNEALKADPPGWYRSNKLNPAAVADESPQVRGEDSGNDTAKPPMQQHEEMMRRMEEGLMAPPIRLSFQCGDIIASRYEL